MKELTDENRVEELLNRGNTPTVLDFWASWCGPCKAMAPILEELSAEYDGQINFLKIDVDKNPKLSEEFKVQGIPTFFFIKNDDFSQLVGMQTKETLVNELENLIQMDLEFKD